eukprot:350264-Chlamydomonas_euryale.AAC.9
MQTGGECALTYSTLSFYEDCAAHGSRSAVPRGHITCHVLHCTELQRESLECLCGGRRCGSV